MIDGKWAIVSEFIEGKTLLQIATEDNSKKNECIEKLVDVQIEILKRKCPLLTKLKDKMTRKINMSKVDNNTKFELLTRLNSLAKENKLCHGDLNLSNVILGNDGKMYVIDWAHATQGDASADVARSYLRFKLDNDVEGAEYYLSYYCKKVGVSKMKIQKWMPIVACSQSVKEKDEEQELLLSWVNVVEY